MKIESLVNLPVGVAIRWDDTSESLIPFQKLRDACPCANCSGETDLFGRKVGGVISLIPAQSYDLSSYRMVGHYAVQFIWGDNHDAGIYSYELLKELGEGEGGKG